MNTQTEQSKQLSTIQRPESLYGKPLDDYGKEEPKPEVEATQPEASPLEAMAEDQQQTPQPVPDQYIPPSIYLPKPRINKSKLEQRIEYIIDPDIFSREKKNFKKNNFIIQSYPTEYLIKKTKEEKE